MKTVELVIINVRQMSIAKMANAKLSDSDLVKVKALREEGKKFHKAGKHDESMKALGEAKKMLGI